MKKRVEMEVSEYTDAGGIATKTWRCLGCGLTWKYVRGKDHVGALFFIGQEARNHAIVCGKLSGKC